MSHLREIHNLLRSHEEKGRSYAEGEFKNNPQKYILENHHWHRRLEDYLDEYAIKGGLLNTPLLTRLDPEHPIAKMLPGENHVLAGQDSNYVLSADITKADGTKTRALLPLSDGRWNPRHGKAWQDSLSAHSGVAFAHLLTQQGIGSTIWNHEAVKGQEQATLQHIQPHSVNYSAGGSASFRSGGGGSGNAREFALFMPRLSVDNTGLLRPDQHIPAGMRDAAFPLENELADITHRLQQDSKDPSYRSVLLNPMDEVQYRQQYDDTSELGGILGRKPSPRLDEKTGLWLMDFPRTIGGLSIHAITPDDHAVANKSGSERQKALAAALREVQKPLTGIVTGGLDWGKNHEDESANPQLRAANAAQRFADAGVAPDAPKIAQAGIDTIKAAQDKALKEVLDGKYEGSELSGDPVKPALYKKPVAYQEQLQQTIDEGIKRFEQVNRKTWTVKEAHFMPENGIGIVKPVEMWHGTSPEVAQSVVDNGFRVPEKAAHGRAFGDGIYLSRHFEKSAQYPFHTADAAMLRVAMPSKGLVHLDSPEAIEDFALRLTRRKGNQPYKRRIDNMMRLQQSSGYEEIAHKIKPDNAADVTHLLGAGIQGISYPARYRPDAQPLTGRVQYDDVFANVGAAAVQYPPAWNVDTSGITAVRPSKFVGQEAVWYDDPSLLRITAHIIGKKGPL